ncbi:MAG TPA: YkuS family protein [Symbiobacteriaceae bacterium]|nr:YkuS family protein [Symbiobacteriaceae bacterium]
MARRVAVQDGLEHVKQALRAQGFEVTKLTQGQMNDVSAAVVTGLSNNVMGIADTNGNKFPVVEAQGLTANEVVSSIRTRLERIES